MQLGSLVLMKPGHCDVSPIATFQYGGLEEEESHVAAEQLRKHALFPIGALGAARTEQDQR